MSRKYERNKKVNEKLRQILDDPRTLDYLIAKIVRPRSKWMPRFMWRFLLSLVYTVNN